MFHTEKPSFQNSEDRGTPQTLSKTINAANNYFQKKN